MTDTFNIKELGSFYSKEQTTFKVYAPYAKSIKLVIDGNKYDMENCNGSYTYVLTGDLEKHTYHYENDEGTCFADPFAYANTSDENESYILDTSKFNVETYVPKEYTSKTIYEVSVRDFSSANEYYGKYKGKLKALVESGLNYEGRPIGFDYLKSLGISHLQLMPVFDFDDDLKSGSDYNWGYNPTSYNSLKHAYITNPEDPYNLVNELREVVNTLHQNNIRVTLDVVFNHVYDEKTFNLGKMMNGNIYRVRKDGTLAEGSLCGNEIKSEHPFVRAYLTEMCERYFRLFDIDGLRFDIMGLIDYETINNIKNKIREIKKDSIFYGEGWNMGDVLDESMRASINNLNKMPEVSVFNPAFRDDVISYTCGNEGLRDKIKGEFNGYNDIGINVEQTINYVECHDGFTFFDRINFGNEDFETKKRRSKLALAMTLLSRGTAFIQAGEEFLRTKWGIENSYNSNDDVNKIDWRRMSEFYDVTEYAKTLIDIRNKYSEDFKKDANIYDYYEVIVFEYENLKIYFNPCMYDHCSNDGYIYKMIFDGFNARESQEGIISIPAYCVTILDKNK